MENKLFDVTIIGGGPVGLYAAFYAGMREMKTKIIETLPELGGQLTALYPDKPVYDVPGFPEIKAKDLANLLIKQAKRYNPTIVLNQKAIFLDRDNDGTFVIHTNTGDKHYTKTIIIAVGIGAFQFNTLNRKGVKEFEGRGVYYFVKDFGAFKGKRVLVVGGGDSAVDWALHLQHPADKVTLIHRREGFRAYEKNVKELFNSQVEVKLHYELKEIIGDNHVKKAVIFHNKTMAEESIPVDAVILALGYKAGLGELSNWGFEMDGRYIKVNVRMETSIPGIFACGDIVSVEGLGNIKLMATGFGQAAIAVGAAKNYIDPTAKIFGGHSSSLIPSKSKR